jgi:hypothetical protein
LENIGNVGNNNIDPAKKGAIFTKAKNAPIDDYINIDKDNFLDDNI